MFIRPLFRSSVLRSPARGPRQSFTRGLRIAAPRIPTPPTLPFRTSSPLAVRSPSYTPSSRRYASFEPPQYPRQPRNKPPRIKYTRFDPREIEKAEPLINDRIFHRIRHGNGTKWIIVFATASAVVFYVSNLETVPVSGRRRFNCYSDKAVEEEGKQLYKMIMHENQKSILPEFDRRSKMVRRVMERLIPHSGLEGVDWEVQVIESDECNAFVIPGGKVFVYSGILNITQNDDGLAAVLGHEIAHNVARHQAEQMSGMILLAPLRWSITLASYYFFQTNLGGWLGDLVMDFGLMKPASRKQESEADYIGLMMMAQSCYDPSAAVGVWERMEMRDREREIPQWLSTHPSNSSRIATMQEWLPKAQDVRNASECAGTARYAADFQDALRDPWGIFTTYRR